MKAIELQNIPPKGYFFKDFGEILQGKCKTDRLEDIIGAVSEINHIQSNTPGKKVVVYVVLKDLKGNCINCNLWEIYGSKFLAYYNDPKNNGAIVILLTHAMVKDGQVSNAWSGSKLLINEDIPEIQALMSKLPTNEQKEKPTQSAKSLSNWSGGSQYSPVEKQKEKPTQSAKSLSNWSGGSQYSPVERKNAAKARIYRKSVIDDKKSKRLKTTLKENGTFDKRRDNDSTALRIPLSELSPNILNDGRGIANVEVGHQLHSSLKTKPSTNNNIRSKRISSRNITKLGVNLAKRFDNTFAATTSNQDPIPELQLNELFASDSGDNNMNDESDGYSSATNSSFDEDEMSNGTDAMETFEITSGYSSESDGESYDDTDNNTTNFTTRTSSEEGRYYDICDPIVQCQECGASMWYRERKYKSRNIANPKFSICCGNGKIQLPLLKMSPKVLQDMLFGSETSESRTFQQHIRMYNVMFAFTSPSEKMDNRFNNGRGPPTFHIQGYQYPLLFPYGEDGYRPNVKHRANTSNPANNQQTSNSKMQFEDIPWEEATKRNRLTIREWLVVRTQSRPNEAPTLLKSRRLYQQFLVDGFTMME
ncbi:hypothetical protein KIW84_058029 [Lathyrus oleraceus]|uniref:Uncharacterized protein n=1 Tax=Pisum sativum TaxID=3888 RepID=A0A9D5ANG9_PEA|nr:hypothetical protein KIW84_058029 [Pisum sativum]